MLSLDEIATLARKHTITPSERRAQRLSLIMGLTSHKSTLTREQVSGWVDQIEGHEPLPKSETNTK